MLTEFLKSWYFTDLVIIYVYDSDFNIGMTTEHFQQGHNKTIINITFP